METLKKLLRTHALRYTIILVAGLFLGGLLFGGPDANHLHAESEEQHDAGEGQTVWTCSMHPQIRMDEPGNCPICGMALIPVSASAEEIGFADDHAIRLSEEAAALADIQTETVESGHVMKNIRLFGTIAADERRNQSQSSHAEGRIESLAVTFTGEKIKKGQLIAAIYSPELLTAQQELIQAAKHSETMPELFEAAKEKLRLLKLTDDRIDEILTSGNASPLMNIYAEVEGSVVSKEVNPGDYVQKGQTLFVVNNYSKIWGIFDAFEEDLPFLNPGDEVEFSVRGIPDAVFAGKITFISPQLNAESRTVQIRVETDFSDPRLRPGLFATADISAALGGHKSFVSVPKSAVLWTGTRSVVYLKDMHESVPTFRMQEVELGPSLGSDYVILSGLSGGKEIVVNGAFSIDAGAQLEGRNSMMNRAGHDEHEDDHSDHTMPEDEHNSHEVEDHSGHQMDGGNAN